MEDLKGMLQQMLEKKKADKAAEDQMRQEKNDGDRNKILENLGKDFGGVIQPYIDKMGEHSRMSAEELKRIISESVQVTAPNVDTAGIQQVLADAFANLKFPEPKVHVAAPVIPAPVIKVNTPDVKFPDSIKLTPNSKPFPVVMVDQAGKPMMFPSGGGSSGPGFPMQTLDQVNNAIRVSFSSTGSTASALIDSSGVQYSGTNPLPVVFGSSATSASNIVDSSGIAYSGSNPVPIAIISGSSSGATGQGDAASATRVVIAGNSDASVVVNSGTITTVTTLTGITNSVATSLVDSSGVAYSGSNPIPVTQSSPVGQGDSASALRFVQAGDSVSSVIVNSGTITTVTTLTGITNSIAVVTLDRDGNPQTQSAIAQGDAAAALRVVIAGNSDASVVVNSGTITTVTTLTGITNSVAVALTDSGGVQYSTSNPIPVTNTDLPKAQGDAATALRVVIAGNSDASVVVNSGTITTVTTLTGITNTVAVLNVDSGGVGYSGSNPLPVTFPSPIAQGDAASALRVIVAGNSDASVVVNSGTITTVTTLTTVTNSIAAALVDSGNVQYSGSNPLPITVISGALTSTIAVGDTLARVTDIGAAPIKVGGIARTTNPTAYADGDRANFGSDKLGRQLVRNVQIRDLIKTAYVTLSTGTEATLITASAGTFLDCIWMAFANTSSAAQQIDVRCTSAGNIVHTAYVPANSTVGWAPAVPWPQDATGNAWTVDIADVTNSNILITALFTQEL